MERYPGYFIAPLRINDSGIESMLSLFKFCAAGNLSANNCGSIRGRVITGKEVVSNSNSERGYRDDRILVSGNLQQSETSAGSRVAYSVRVVFDPFGLDRAGCPVPIFSYFLSLFLFYTTDINIIKENKGRCKELTIRGHRKNLSPRWDSNPRPFVF